METPPTLSTTKRSRPRLRRSHSAAAETSPPENGKSSTAHHVSKKLHLLAPYRSDLRGGHTGGSSEKGALTSSRATFKNGPLLLDKAALAKAGSASDIIAGSSRNADVQSTPTMEIIPARQNRQPVRLNEVLLERQRRAQRDDELQSSLNDLASLATRSASQIDNIWFTIVERVRLLRSTIQDFEQLYTDSKGLRENFKQETNKMTADFEKQTDRFGDFETQREQIDHLEQRMKQSIDKTNELSNRLEAARKRVELWEKRENEWQARTTLRLRVGWTCGFILLSLILLLILTKKLYWANSARQMEYNATLEKWRNITQRWSWDDSPSARELVLPVQPAENNTIAESAFRALDEL